MRAIPRAVSVLALVGALALAGCAAGAESTVSAAETSSAARLTLLDQAESADADESQIAILRQEEITFDDYSAAISRTVECISAHGIPVVGPSIVRHQGQDILEFSFGASSDLENELVSECIQVYSAFVDRFWQTSTVTALEWVDRLIGAMTEPMMQCLGDFGVDVPRGATWWEMVPLAGDHADANPDEDCFHVIGFFGWDE